MSLAGAFLDLVLPIRCLGCGGAAGRGRTRPVCPACATRIRPLPEPVCRRCGTPLVDARSDGCDVCPDWPDGIVARSHTRWSAPADRVVEALKYDGWPEVGLWLGARLARDAGPGARGSWIVPVPTTRSRLRDRGFNPAERIATGLASALGSEVLHALVRPRESPRQVGLPADRRPANVRGAFLPEPRARARLGTQPIILVDDVLTTGATAVEAAGVLLDAGAPSVRVLTFARSLPDRPGDLRRAS